MNATATEGSCDSRAFRRESRVFLEPLGEFRRDLRAYLAERAVPADTTADVLLAVQEAAQNGVCTGAGHAVHVAVWPQGRVVSASVKDYGEGLADDPSRVCPPAWNTHGRGLHLMRRVMDRVAIDCSDGTSVCMRRHSLSRSQSA